MLWWLYAALAIYLYSYLAVFPHVRPGNVAGTRISALPFPWAWIADGALLAIVIIAFLTFRSRWSLSVLMLGSVVFFEWVLAFAFR